MSILETNMRHNCTWITQSVNRLLIILPIRNHTISLLIVILCRVIVYMLISIRIPSTTLDEHVLGSPSLYVILFCCYSIYVLSKCRQCPVTVRLWRRTAESSRHGQRDLFHWSQSAMSPQVVLTVWRQTWGRRDEWRLCILVPHNRQIYCGQSTWLTSTWLIDDDW